MAVCLEDLQGTLQQILAALDGQGGTEAPSISISARASADAEANLAATQITNVQVQAISIASANALAIVDVDVSATINATTTIVNVPLHPVSGVVPPAVAAFPEAETGVSDTPRTGASVSGDTCQAIYYMLDSVAGLLDFLSRFPTIGYLAASALSSTILPAIWAAEFFLASKGIIIPRPALAALTAFLAGLAAANNAVQEIISNAALYLVVQRDALAQLIFCLFENGADTSVVSEAIFDDVRFGADENAAMIISFLLSSNILASLIFESAIYDASGVVDDCSGFICGD